LNTMRPALLLLFSVSLFGQSWTPEYALKVQNVAAVTPSPDGAWVAYTQTKAWVDAEHSELVPQVWLAHADGSRRMQLTQGEKGASAPSFSPDSKYVYFTSSRSGTAQVYRILIKGGEAEQLTSFKGSLGSYQVSPDGKRVAFTGYEPPADLEKAKKEKRDFKVLDSKPENFALYLIPADEDATGKRTQKKVFETKYHVGQFDWSPDGRIIAFDHTPTPLADEWPKSAIAEVDVESGAITERSKVGTGPHYSPDGKYLAYQSTSIPARWAGQQHVTLMTRASGTERALPATFDEQPNLLGWKADSKGVLIEESKHTRAAMYFMPVDGPTVVIYEPEKGTLGAVKMNAAGTHIGFEQESPELAPEAFCMPAEGGKATQVSRANTDLPKPALGETKVISWKGKDGRAIEGLLTYPVGYESGRRYPLILNIHGGPTGVFSEAFIGKSSIYNIAAFASRGYAVLRPNPRGSSGYGKEFRFANMADWGGMDYLDDMAGVDHVISMGVADPEKLGIMGWSYGGFMTSWAITQTNRFKAAAVGAGVTDLWSFTGTSDIPGFLPDYFGGDATDQFENFHKHSAMTYVKNVKTPTLILHGEADVRVPTSQGYEFYNALKREEVPVKMVVYPRQPHGPYEPKFVMDIAQRNLDWMDQYVR
jgi:dipeptidyl aminopeptidase/acylaminoacyl peptidase